MTLIQTQQFEEKSGQNIYRIKLTRIVNPIPMCSLCLLRTKQVNLVAQGENNFKKKVQLIASFQLYMQADYRIKYN